MHHGSKNRLMPRHAALFPGTTLFDELARAVCTAGVLPRKELYEAWEVARRVRRRIRGRRVIDFACGHALLAHVLLLLDDTSPCAIAFDVKLPPSAHKLHDALVARWPRLGAVEPGGPLGARVRLVEEAPAVAAGDLVVSCHACGALTDDAIALAVRAGAAVAVLPCCHDEDTCDAGSLAGWMELGLAVDATRAHGLRAAGYDVITQQIPADVTPKNRLLIGAPARSSPAGSA